MKSLKTFFEKHSRPLTVKELKVATVVALLATGFQAGSIVQNHYDGATLPDETAQNIEPVTITSDKETLHVSYTQNPSPSAYNSGGARGSVNDDGSCGLGCGNEHPYSSDGPDEDRRPIRKTNFQP